MFQNWNVLIGIACTVFGLLLLRKSKMTGAAQPEKICTTEESPVLKAAPALPERLLPDLPPPLPPRCLELQMLDYPKCPIDRSRNEPGKPQVVFRDRENGCYVCHHGHRFTGRE